MYPGVKTICEVEHKVRSVHFAAILGSTRDLNNYAERMYLCRKVFCFYFILLCIIPVLLFGFSLRKTDIIVFLKKESLKNAK